jgi:hypothetical protein
MNDSQYENYKVKMYSLLEEAEEAARKQINVLLNVSVADSTTTTVPSKRKRTEG